MSRRLAGGRRLASCVTLICLAVELLPAAAAPRPASRLERMVGPGAGSGLQPASGAWVAPASPATSRDYAPPILLASGNETQADSSAAEAGRKGPSRNAKIVGTTLFATGIFLASWGITSWQRDEDQCCPPRNSENVIKITVGIVLIDAGLVYLLGGVD